MAAPREAGRGSGFAPEKDEACVVVIDVGYVVRYDVDAVEIGGAEGADGRPWLVRGADDAHRLRIQDDDIAG